MAMRYSTDRIAYTVISSANFDSSYPASRVADISRPRRVARSVSGGGGWWATIIVELAASPVALWAITIEAVNFTQVNIWGSITSSTNPEILLPGSPYTIGLDNEDGRRKIAVALAGTSYRWLKFSLELPLAGQTYMEVGAIGCWSSLTTLSKNVWPPYGKNPQLARRVLEYDSGAKEVQSLGPTGLMLSTSTLNVVRNSTAHAQYAALARTPPDQILLWYENEGDTSKMYHVRLGDSWEISRTGSGYVDVTGIRLEQTV